MRLLYPLRQRQTNKGTLHTTTLTQAIAAFSNHHQLTATTWHQTGKTFTNHEGGMIDINGTTSFETTSLTNNGDITLEGQATGHIQQMHNTGGFTLNGDTHLTGVSFHNTKVLTTTQPFHWTGQTFTSTPQATLRSQNHPLHVTTTTPLTLNGTVHMGAETMFTAPSIQNRATIQGDAQSHVTFNGLLSNHKAIRVHTLTYEGKTLTNAGIIDVDRHHRTTRLDHLDNKAKASFTVRRGGFHAKTIRNRGALDLKEGRYQTEQWDNNDGTATMDQFTVDDPMASFDGILEVNVFNGRAKGYRSLSVKGKTIFHSGTFHADVLDNTETLSLGKGTYSIDQIKQGKTDKLLLHDGANVVLKDGDNKGQIAASVPVTVHFAPESPIAQSSYTPITDAHITRKHAFNAIPRATTPIHKTRHVQTVYTHSQTITDQLSAYDRVSADKKADQTQLKRCLQAVMGTEVTRLLHPTTAQETLDFQKTLPVLPQTDQLYGHFEILRRTSQITRAALNALITMGTTIEPDSIDALEDTLPTFKTDYGILKRYRHDLTKRLFVQWLTEVLLDHDEGLTPFKKQKPHGRATTVTQDGCAPYVTYRTPESQTGGLRALLDTHENRQTAFNAIPTALSFTAKTHKKTVAQATRTIHALLGTVTSKKATDSERKRVLQAVMGSEITNSLDHMTDGTLRDALHLDTHLPTLTRDHTFYKHFEILRLTSKLSQLLVKHLLAHGSALLDECLSEIPDFDADNRTLCQYSGLSQDLFRLWFRDVFEQHTKGFPKRKGASLTFLTSETTSSLPSAFRHSTIGSTHTITLHLPQTINVADFLYTYRQTFAANETLRVIGHTFMPTRDMELGHAVEMWLTAYQNDHYDLAFSALDLVTKTFKHGKSNTEIATLRTAKALSTRGAGAPDPTHKHHLTITVQQDADTRYGIILGEGDTTVISQEKNVRWGDEMKALKDVIANIYYGGDCTHSITAYTSNRSLIGSNRSLIIRALKGTLVGHYGELFSSLDMQLITDKHDQDITTLSSQIKCGRDFTIRTNKWHYTRRNPHRHSFGEINRGNGNIAYNCYADVFVTKTAHLDVWGNAHLDVNQADITANDMIVGGSLFLKDKCIKRDFNTHLMLHSLVSWVGSHFGDKENGRHTPTIRVGDRFEGCIGTMSIGGNVSARTFDLHMNTFTLAGTSKATARLHTHGIAVTIEGEADKRTGGLFMKGADGTYQSRFPMSPQKGVVTPEQAPVFGKKALGLEGENLMHPSIELLATLGTAAQVIGRLYDHYTNTRIEQALLLRGQDYALRGELMKPGGLDTLNLPKSCIFYQQMVESGKWVLTLWVPYHERDQDAGQEAIFKGKKGTLTTTGDMTLDSAKLVTEKKLNLIIGGDLKGRTGTWREQTHTGYRGHLNQHTQIGTTGEDSTFSYTVNGHEHFAGVERIAGTGGITSHIKGNRTHTTTVCDSYDEVHDGETTLTTEEHTHHGCRSVTTGKIDDHIEGESHCINEHLEGRKGIRQTTVHGNNLFTTQNNTKQTTRHTQSDGGFFGGKSRETQITGRSHCPNGTTMITDDDHDIILTSHEGSAFVQQPTFRGKRVIFNTPNGIAGLLQGIDTTWSSSTTQDDSLWWKSIAMEMHHARTYTEGSSTCPIEFHARKVLLEQVEGRVSRLLSQFDIKEGTLEISMLKEVYEHDSFEHDGPTAALTVVVALAATLCTMGAAAHASGYLVASAGMATAAGTTAAAGTVAAGTVAATTAATATGLTAASGCIAAAGAGATLTTAGSYAATMLAAGMTAIASHFAVSMLNHKGDPLQSLNSLATTETIKRVALSMATAGVLKGIGDTFSLPTNAEEVSKTVQQATKAAELTEATLAQQLPAHAACQAAHAASNISMNTLFGQRFEESIKSDRVGGGITSSVLSHHRTCVVAYGGFNTGFTQFDNHFFQAE